ncbi:CLUMA_CG019867, isoform A [Clunio marinus]|uniref:CLUMA_CG019867, isoform A n=1 Tax=Clunio marinus TaxID=568069 RepID=A0A1J1J3X5_9DIPT|nr:CLUMA_CG019867, isoform A [Clunio marinus]
MFRVGVDGVDEGKKEGFKGSAKQSSRKKRNRLWFLMSINCLKRLATKCLDYMTRVGVFESYEDFMKRVLNFAVVNFQ